ncbi:oxidoreductase [Shewanella cyperi]|uniref:oxidoreductase n=1 Tax=Shewanella cyperi TaxID=2814292 RepID=UPI001A93AFDB|nr:NADH:flavin oxidoreductase [Shewanella cyperi]QSX41824.1 NADH:flavin oxidoreductase [Shewanella cyperi]
MQSSLSQPWLFPDAGIRAKNRAVLAPLTHNMSLEGGLVSDNELIWLEKAAAGGFGTLIAAATLVADGGRCWPGQPALLTGQHQARFAEFARIAASHGALALVQLHHGGVRAIPGLNGRPPVGPSAIPAGGRYPLGVEALTDEGIEAMIAAFADAAVRAHGAGLHGVELHAAHHFLLCNFLNPEINQRSDKWGGSAANRARILLEIIGAIRARVPRSFLIGVRLSPESYANVQGIKLMNQLEITRLLAAGGLDYVHFSMGDSFKQADEFAGESLLALIASQLGGKLPLMVAGKVQNARDGDALLGLGADMVAVGSAAIGNPDWVKRQSAGQQLIAAPFSESWLLAQGFNERALDYFRTVPGLVL